MNRTEIIAEVIEKFSFLRKEIVFSKHEPLYKGCVHHVPSKSKTQSWIQDFLACHSFLRLLYYLSLELQEKFGCHQIGQV